MNSNTNDADLDRLALDARPSAALDGVAGAPAVRRAAAQPVAVALRVLEAERVDALDGGVRPRRSCPGPAPARSRRDGVIGKWCSHCGQTLAFFSRSAVSRAARQPGHFVNTPPGRCVSPRPSSSSRSRLFVPGHGSGGAYWVGRIAKAENRSRNRLARVLLCCAPCISAPGIPSRRRAPRPPSVRRPADARRGRHGLPRRAAAPW